MGIEHKLTPPLNYQPLLKNTGRATIRGHLDFDAVSCRPSPLALNDLHFNLQGEVALSSVSGFSCSATDTPPLEYPSFDPFLAYDLCKRITTSDTMQKPECVSKITFAACIRTNDNSEVTDIERGFLKSLESFKDELRQPVERPRTRGHFGRRKPSFTINFALTALTVIGLLY